MPLNIIHPALDSASLQEDADLQAIWANLLANAADPRQISSVLPSFPTILKDLVSRDVKFLDALYASAQLKLKRMGPNPHISGIEYADHDLLKIYADAKLSRRPSLNSLSVKDWNDHRQDLSADMNELHVTITTAIRHQVLNEFQRPEPIKLSGYFESFRSPNNSYQRVPDKVDVRLLPRYSLTHLGSSFLAACQVPKKIG